MASFKEFLEEYPLYRKMSAENVVLIDQKHLALMAFASGNPGSPKKYIAQPPINSVCPICKSVQTYNLVNNFGDDGLNYAGQIFRADYVCSSCKIDRKVFYLHFFNIKTKNDEEDEIDLYVQKVGQYPAWSIQIEQTLEEILGKHKELFKKGLICESQGYGIGAYGYFRRITENIIDDLLDSLLEVLDDSEKQKYSDALKLTKQTKIAQDKIRLVKDLLPTSLRPDGMNPLDVLHSALSEGLHERDDEDCLEYADAIKKVLTYLVNQILKKKEDSKVFTEGMRKLLNKKSKKKVH